ncbi:hypothetical protein Despr_1677 [Desulfobulbus propionicus DSM 2032]|uniref:Uncharacterized protein n=1 Tax=Desulfobulbus propionicus (strain ATCC 33891 / DSM 2032 / VKM B-1956 / 1pr3) TaxID=577650 RepID=A0A7U4DP99_DESPD|nr:hypothetical protein [Desulfobulbus propionicus]ADW17829.1 hypothetical protein Despr_1677 [Desulfobulbus propionicus DSM 2032]
MEMFNFSADEIRRLNRALSFVGKREAPLDQVAARTLIVKTENFSDECEQLAPYYAPLGLENRSARLVFAPKEGQHKILLNKETVAGLSYIHSLVTEMVHLGNLSRYAADHGNVYRLEPSQAIADYYYEFLLWTKFQAMKIATRCHALVCWHEVNGETPPADGRYQFAQVDFPRDALKAGLRQLADAGDIATWREGFWDALEELSLYFGRLAFYQLTAQPEKVDERFPAPAIEATLGLENCLALYACLHRAREYKSWLEERRNLRAAIVAMEGRGKQRFQEEGEPIP